MDALDRLVKNLENRKLDRSLTGILHKLEGEMLWEVTKSVECRGYDRNGEVVVKCQSR